MKVFPLSQAELLLCGRMMAERLGWPGFVGLLLIILAITAEFVWLPQQQTHIELSEDESRLMRREIVRLNAAGKRNLDPQARLDALLAHFPEQRQLPQELARLNELLTTAGVQVNRASYQPDTAKSSDFSSVIVSMQIKVSYPRLRLLFDSIRENMPTVAIDDIQLTRDAIGTTEAEARLRFKLYLRQAT